MKPLIYLATTYRIHPEGIAVAYVEAAKLTARLIKDGHRVFSPIVHTHPIAVYGNMDAYSDAWLDIDGWMMDVCDQLWIANWDGALTRSTGIAHERKEFEAQRKPIFVLNSETLTTTRLI